MAEPVAAWWARRQFSRAREVPYPLGAYREAWDAYPVLRKQYHPELNGGVALSQIPPAAEVLLQWQCEVGHIFVATPGEQRMRPGGPGRRRSAWCPECSIGAVPRVPVTRMPPPGIPVAPPGKPDAPPTVLDAPPAFPPSRPSRRPAEPRPRPPRRLCGKTPTLPAGTPFRSECAPKPASAVEAELRAELTARLDLDLSLNAVRVDRPFFDHLEVWPDIPLAELRVAIEYDSPGRFGLEHLGRREDVDQRKDRLLRGAGWEVVRIRTGRLPRLGPNDLVVPGLSRKVYPLLLDRLRELRGPLFVDAYLR